ncbi:MAG: putative zinc-binding protein [Halobacteriota archaeon]
MSTTRGNSMKDDDRQVLLLTCSGISHTGRLTTKTGTWLRYRHPRLITRHLQLTTLKRPLDEELRDEENLVAVDGCEECCIKKRMDAIGTRPDVYIVATREGIIKRGMEEARSEEIEALSQVIVRKVRE